MANLLMRIREFFRDYRATKYREELRTDWGSALIYRPPALVIAAMLATTKIRPTTVTALGALLLPAMALAALLLSPACALAAVLVLSILYLIVDCIDGALARATGQVSASGHYWDLIADLAYRGVAYVSVGYLADQLFPWTFAISQATVLAVAAWLAAFARLARNNLDRLAPAQKPAEMPTTGFNFLSFLTGLDTMFPFLVGLAWATGQMTVLVLWVLIYSLGDVAISLNDARDRFRSG